MTNKKVCASYLTGRYWQDEILYITDNGDGTWHITHWGSREPDRDVSAVDAQKLCDGLADSVSKSRMKDWASYSVAEINTDNVEKYTDSLLKSYDPYTCMIDSFAQQMAAEANNRAIAELVERIENAVKVAKAA